MIKRIKSVYFSGLNTGLNQLLCKVKLLRFGDLSISKKTKRQLDR